MTLLYVCALILLLALCSFTCLLVLVQEGKGGGLGASFGGETSTAVFGTATADILKRITATCGALFLCTCIVLSFWTAALSTVRAGPPELSEMISKVGSGE